jgi:hypothetical protein
MIRIENTETFGWKGAVRGMRNPLESWGKSDSVFEKFVTVQEGRETTFFYPMPCVELGENDLDLMKRLRNAGSDDRKFMRMIHVQCDITAPLYWWKEYDTYKIGTVANSCSTMHKIHSRDLTLDDFSHENLGVLVPTELNDGEEVYQNLWIEMLKETIKAINIARYQYETEPNSSLRKKYWEQMIQLLPSSYNQRRTVDLNYEVLVNMYHARNHHKLNEWRVFCDWVKTLPYAKELIVGA